MNQLLFKLRAISFGETGVCELCNNLVNFDIASNALNFVAKM